MTRLLRRMFGSCEHPHTLVVSSVGVRRTVCEDCGHISFTMTNPTRWAKKTPAEKDLPRAAGL